MVLVVVDDLINKTTTATATGKVCITEDEAIEYVNEKNENLGIGSEKRYRYLLDY